MDCKITIIMDYNGRFEIVLPKDDAVELFYDLADFDDPEPIVIESDGEGEIINRKRIIFVTMDRVEDDE